MAWTDEKKQKVIEQYEDIMKNEYDSDEGRAAATIEVVKQLAEEHGEAVNGVRIMLSKAGVYIKAATKKPATKSESGGTKRVNKAEALQELKNIINSQGKEVDEEIISKLTGKAAQYFAGILATGE